VTCLECSLRRKIYYTNHGRPDTPNTGKDDKGDDDDNNSSAYYLMHTKVPTKIT
jgi:hypothetical protein